MGGRTDCNGCRFAEWKRRAGGSLHPSGDGWCTYTDLIKPLPGAFYWLGISPPEPCGGNINRRNPLKRPCAYYQPTD